MSKDLYQKIIDISPDFVFESRVDNFQFTKVNERACKFYGYTKSEFLKMNIFDIEVDPPIKEQVRQLYDKTLIGTILEVLGSNKKKDGTIFPVLVRFSKINEELAIANVRDITDRKGKEKELMKNIEFQQLIIKISTLFINLPADEIDKAINDQLEEIGRFFDAVRVTIAKLSEKGEVLGASHMWFSDKINAEKLTEHMMGATYPNFAKHIKDKEYWSFSNPDDFSHWHPERETIEKTDMKSGLAIKLNFDGSVLETFVIDHIQSNYIWTPRTIEQVKLLGNVFSNALNRKQAEQTVKKSEEFKQLVSQISTKFIGLTGVEFEDAIQDTLIKIGSYLGVDTVRLYQLSEQGEVLKFRLMWRSEHLPPSKEIPEIHNMKFPNLAAHFSKGESVVFGKVDDSPPWPELRKILKIFGSKAGVEVPLESNKSGVDVFGMNRVLSEYTWPEDIIEQSKAIGKVLLSAVRRREAEVELQNSYDEITQLKNRLEQENIYLQEDIKLQQNFETIIGQSTSLNYVLHRLEQVAPTDATVLIGGETGTGKELFAHALHSTSRRKHMPLIKVGCASLSSNLIESEFFGHEKGAFTGADKQRIGRFELANGGTIFLDEISEISLELQAKLLRVLQEGEFERLGSSKTIKIDVRVIAATNRNLEEEVSQGRFREDLYYRLTTFILTVPPLRDRNDDIPLLVRFFVEKLGKKLGKKIKSIPKKSMRIMENYSWPGNIRELQNVIENAIIVSVNEILKVEIPGSSILSNKGNLKLKDIERDHIIEVLNSTNWRLGGKRGAAELLGMKRTTLYENMKKIGIER